ncbi:dihydroxyacetone kinase DhaL subunit [Rhizobiales bacterium GAS191]|nr:dihydroxyacetone kinase DhaL subunit [Rhizobiales bacterium GAS113]SEE55567.1 dihydroxyacetone kinase DhaL subunit [Rhizobiales bacterium GAS191]
MAAAQGKMLTMPDAPFRLDSERKRRLVAAVANRIIAHADELTALDSAIGDGDHGHNMKRGCEAVLQDLDALSAMQVPDLLKAVGTKLVMKVGGASGPLYGTLFMSLGKELAVGQESTLGKEFFAEPSRAELVTAFAAAITAVKARGKSDVGQKTLLDVLAPVHATLAAGGDLAAIKDTATKAAEATVPMRAIRGRASFLGERSIGHMDPGARSSSLMIAALCDEFGES